MAAEAVLEAGCARYAIRDQRLTSIVPFLDQRVAHAEALALDGRTAIGTRANLREARDLLGDILGFLPRPTFRGEVLDVYKRQALYST